jgi:hypothetical protein
MAKGISIHVALNYIDPANYGGWEGVLGGCENDAYAWEALAKGRGFDTRFLLNESATSHAVLGEILAAAEHCDPGDLFLLTYSGHGGQVPDRDNDEPDGRDETWLLFDRQVLDDELFAAFARFKAGTRIVVVSDSCHSGTVTRGPATETTERSRLAPEFACKANFDSIGSSMLDGIKDAPKAICALASPVLLLSGCQDNQTSGDDGQMGVFSRAAMEVWGAGWTRGDYRLLRSRISAKLPSTQTPNLLTNGPGAKHLERQLPFTI